MRWEVLIALAMLAGTAPVAAAGIMPDDPSQLEDERKQALLAEDSHPVDEYHTWETLTADLQQLVANNPEIARLHSAGESVMGLDLWYVEIANFRDENKTPLDQRETIYLDGGTHANEQLGMELAYEWAEFLIEDYGENETATWIVDNRHTVILPLVNPDGNHMDSRWNANTVNINRNFPFGWAGVDENPVFNDPGPYPASEPETQAVIDVIDKYEPDYVNSFHTGIELMLYPWGFEERKPADDTMFNETCKAIGEDDPDFCGAVYDTIYPASGITIDYAYEHHGSAAWTYEVSDEQALYASTEDVRERLDRYWEGVEHAFLNVEKYGAHPVIDQVTLDGNEVEVTVTNEGYGDLPWAEVTVQAPGADDPTIDVDELEAGNTTTLRATVPAADAAEDGRLSAELHYAERHQAQPVETRTEPLPVTVSDDTLEAAPLTEDVTDDVDDVTGEELDVASVEEADDGPMPVPATGALIAGLVLGLAAIVHRRR
jgi:predicted deacylase